MTRAIFTIALLVIFLDEASCLSLAPLDLSEYCRASDLVALVLVEDGRLNDDKDAVYTCKLESVYKDSRPANERGKLSIMAFGKYYIGKRYLVFLECGNGQALVPTGLVGRGRSLHVPIEQMIIKDHAIEDVVSFPKDNLEPLDRLGVTNVGESKKIESTNVYRSTEFADLVKRLSGEKK